MDQVFPLTKKNSEKFDSSRWGLTLGTLAVDGNEIWYGNTETYAPNDPNHAVEVIGIDYSGSEPMVIINDSGTMDGHAITVPASQFMDAWEDSGCYYVEAYA